MLTLHCSLSGAAPASSLAHFSTAGRGAAMHPLTIEGIAF